ncbi:MAG TPA: tRNA (adenosine(37)-N6)-dimethylallyltransferase MiaA [Acidothermaceae bacterium]|nr:tRNA (adenosine(37)-N6)-dimethylallyltransferase MiaA [Acidothermaceae bacterium]
MAGVKLRVIVVVGPTATGKSDLGIELAHRMNGEIVNADSMQLYQGMDVGTAKLTPDERQGVVHHLLDIWPVTRTASVADYQTHARAAIDDIAARGNTPILVGGSGLYIRAVIDDMRFPGTDADVRASLETELAAVGAPAMHARLAAVDSAAAATLLPTNGRKIVRALEVAAIGGGSFTGLMPPYESVYDAVIIGLDRPTAELDERLTQRVATMWERGLVDEVRKLEAVGLRDGVTARRALGYRQVLAMFDGVLSDEQARAQTVQATKRFVRRQRSWFRPDPRINWL